MNIDNLREDSTPENSEEFEEAYLVLSDGKVDLDSRLLACSKQGREYTAFFLINWDNQQRDRFEHYPKIFATSRTNDLMVVQLGQAEFLEARDFVQVSGREHCNTLLATGVNQSSLKIVKLRMRLYTQNRRAASFGFQYLRNAMSSLLTGYDGDVVSEQPARAKP